ncbi:hypothetical protein ATI61_107573 [Archangium gephyra]|uniref:Histone H1 n=1 Tax=Archangium gephyra TaxID=48 RepID=A0AAC8TJ82_9BACT|nr:hypothetical protein [Archangium gephyra]AKJ08142.1 Histone H1 [Archangium gephyra]REG29876.1 hypothetical protein ATI61_107573 [Archangium gephyra]
MPEKQTLQRARQAKRTGKKPTTQASEFVREEMHHMKEGKHGPESREQAIAIGLAKARRAGVDLKPPAPGQATRKTRQSARSAYRRGQEEGELSDTKSASPRRSTTGRKRATARKTTPARKRTTTRGAKTGGRTAAAGRTSRAKTASRKSTARKSTARKGSSTSRSRSSSRTKK